ncbi:MAG: putative toxin-antitoxin system toxin component, PIN family [Lachnospiraceae bacterium]|nr:putative toxin-antitoxin system toxin component, PIN family [Lachnospiraceae bacterium]
MKILIDTNILISTILSPTGVANKAFIKAVSYPNKGFITTQNIEELQAVFARKFPSKMQHLEHFLVTSLSIMELIPIPPQTDNDELHIRDIADRPILRAAKKAKVDAILTGDKDFLEAKLLYPATFSPSEFVNL